MTERIQQFETLKQAHIEALQQYDADYLGRMDIPLAELKARPRRIRAEMDAMLQDPTFVREMRAYVRSRCHF